MKQVHHRDGHHGAIAMAAWLVTCLVAPSVAADQWGLAYGGGMSDVLIQSGETSNARAWALTYDTSASLPTFLQDMASEAEWQWMVNRIVGTHHGQSDGLTTGQFTYVVLGRLGDTSRWRWKAGIGGAWMSGTRFKDIDLIGRSNFSLQAGVLYRLPASGEWTLTYQHYSNGYTRTDNPGLDVWLLGWRHAF